MIQQLRKSILNRNPGLELGFKELSEAAENANRKHFIIEPNDPSFANPPDMYTAVRGFCKMNNQGEPETPGEAAAAIYNGITKEYSQVITDLEAALDRKFHTLHMVGGGIKDTYLCRQTAKAIGRPVVAGPVEASALGNILAQMIGLGEISNITEGREIIRRSFKPVRYE